MARIRTLQFLPEIFKTSTNAQFLGATLDQLVNNPATTKLQGYVGSKFGYGVNAKDYYVTEPDATRTDYQLAPGVAFLNDNQSSAKDFLSYPELIDALKLSGSVVNDNDRLFKSEFYSWDSFTNLDKLINFNQYYWIPEGPPVVSVSSAIVFSETDYVVTDTANAYNIRPAGASSGTLNPTLTLLRGGSYRFAVNQETQFWIQGVPGVTGLDGAQNTRNILGVNNNGASQGYVTFTVPQRNAQDQYLFPGNNTVDVVSTALFSDINGKTLSEIGNIDGVTSLDNLTVMFYNTDEPNEVGFVQSFFDENGANYDVNLTSTSIVSPVTLAITETTADAVITSGSTADLFLNQTVTFTQPDGTPLLGGLDADIIYYIKEIVNATTFRISEQLNGPALTSLTPETGTMNANINEGLFEEGFYTNVSENFYTITYVGDATDPTIRLIPLSTIPNEEKISVSFGTSYIGLDFYRNEFGVILEIPYMSSILDTLYYQDSTSANKIGSIRLIESNLTNTLNVDTDVIGQKTFTSTNGVEFTNGLKVEFQGDVFPSNYLAGEYYVEGVGTAIQLIPTTDLTVPEDFTGTEYIPYDTLNYSIGNFDVELFIPIDEDYITIARDAINRNAWSRSNRWFHIDVITATSTYNEDPAIITTYATGKNKAKRPIIEFYPNLKLFDAGTEAKAPIDFVDTRTTNAFAQVANQQAYYPDIEAYTTYNATIAPATAAETTTITIATTNITKPFQVGQFITDSTNLLPRITTITDITVTGINTVLTVVWDTASTFAGTSVASIVGSDTSVNNYQLFSGARIVFTEDTDLQVRNKIYVVGFSTITPGSTPIITLSESVDSPVLVDNQTVSLRGYYNQGSTFWFDGSAWEEGQQKLTVNQAPLFNVYDKNNVSFGDATIYQGTSFVGDKLFAYGKGTGTNDAVLGFPVRYSDLVNLGDISFDVALNIDTFSYVTGTTPVTTNVNTGYVYNYDSRITKTRELGWQTALAPSVQYQIFELEYTKGTTAEFTCDVAVVPEDTTVTAKWPRIQVYVNNVYQLPSKYTVTETDTSTKVILNTAPTADTPVQILLLSKQTSTTAYYSIPINLSNNPFNENLKVADVGDIRSQYQDIFVNNPNATGDVFGSNNLRDLGNLVPYGTSIIQNSAALVLPSIFLRKSDHNLFNALQFNAQQYVNYKQLIVKTVNDINWTQRFSPSHMLDTALDQIVSSKTEETSFFWSDMLPSQSPYKTNTYTFANALQESIYPLSQTYDFTKANYNGVLVYLTRTTSGVTQTTQLVRDVDYVVSSTAPSLTVTKSLLPNDQITIKEYNQTYGSFVPNTPTKLGMYPKWQPGVVLDPNYQTPTYMLKGHDGSYTSLYTLDYTPATGLTDFRDQVLLEFETRIYNNIKLSTVVPIQAYEVLPGFFRESTYSTEDYLKIYSSNFLNWVGQNRINYKTQQGYTSANEFSWNYWQSANKLTNKPIYQGYWRGVYEYFYGTSQPNIAPWEMLGFSEMPLWWTAQYGAAPYTSENSIMWNDIEAGIIWNGSTVLSVTVPELKRPGLSNILPVDEHGDLKSPMQTLVGNYDSNLFKRDWKVGDDAPAELGYRRSSSYPFDLMRIFALTRPAEFFNLGADLDNYKYNTEFKQYLVNDRSHLDIGAIQIYGSGTAKTSYINWVVDYEKQQGIDATTTLTSLFNNVDVRLIYRIAGFSDKSLLKFFVEKSTPNSNNSSLLIPDESYAVLLHENQPNDQIKFSGVIIQLVNNGWRVYGNSQSQAYFTIDQPITGSGTTTIKVDESSVKIANKYTTKDSEEKDIPYGTQFYTLQQLSQFLASYGHYLVRKGMVFDNIENAVELNWELMIKEYLYWAQYNWEQGSILTVNPSAQQLKIEKESDIVQPLTIQNENFLLNQNLYQIAIKDLNIERLDTKFQVKTLNSGDAMSYGQFQLSNIEHGIVFDNSTLFNDVIYNLVTGLRQNRVYLRGTKTAEWNGTLMASGFILNQDNIKEWTTTIVYPKGSIVTYKSKYWTANSTVQPSATFIESQWTITDSDQIKTGLLPNSATRSFESTLYYNSNKANLENDADQLAFSLIGFRPRDYLASINLTDITQVNVYKNLIKTKGTPNSVSAFKGATLPSGGIDYDVYENWGILAGQFGGTLNNNFVDFRINEAKLTGNPSIVALTNGIATPGSMQEIDIANLFNYARPIDSPNVLSELAYEPATKLYPTAGFVNFDDVKMAAYYYANLPRAVGPNDVEVSINDFYVRDYVWMANFKEKWRVYSWKPIGRVVGVTPNIDNTTTITFAERHGMSLLDPLSLINVASNVNGYYIVTVVNDLRSVTINLPLSEVPQTLTGNGLGLTFIDQRVTKPSEINTLDLNEAEFVKNTVWVDEASDGNWGVYRKSLNYASTTTLNRADGGTFGSAVAYIADTYSYWLGDSQVGIVYRYIIDSDTNTLVQDEDPSGVLPAGGARPTFGTAIAYSERLFVITETTDGGGFPSGKVYIYTVNDSVLDDNPLLLQTLTVGAGAGTCITMSDDQNWIYVGDPTRNSVERFSRERIPLTAGYFTATETYKITSLGTEVGASDITTGQSYKILFPGLTDFTQIGAANNNINTTFTATTPPAGFVTGDGICYENPTDFTAIGAVENKVGILFVSTGVGTGTGTANQVSYREEQEIVSPVGAGGFGSSVATDANGDTISIGAPTLTSPEGNTNWGTSYVYSRAIQNFESQYTTSSDQPHLFELAWDTLFTSTTATDVTSNVITYTGTALTENTAIVFSSIGTFGNSGITPNKVYYVKEVGVGTMSLKETRSTATAIVFEDDATLNSIIYSQAINLIREVKVNGTIVDDNNYAVVNEAPNDFKYFGTLRAGDIITVSSAVNVLAQTFIPDEDVRVGTQLGYATDMTSFGSEVLVGAPGEIRIAGEVQSDGSVYRYTNGGGKYGTVIGTSECLLTADRNLLINGYLVKLVSGSNATTVAGVINASNITNIQAQATDAGTLIISIISSSLALINEKLLLQAVDIATFGELGLAVYTKTQNIIAPHNDSRTMFGNTIKFNETDSVVISAPVSTRYLGTTFDFTDDENLDNDTVFDNNATRFVDTWANAGAIYMYDFLANYNGSVADPGKFIYAQNLNNKDQNYGFEPQYGTSLDFVNNQVVIGTPNLSYGDLEGQVNLFQNASGVKDWVLYRTPSKTVDIDKIQNAQIYSAETNNTLVNLDYIDPMQNKLLGVVRENIDYVDNVDPAMYNAEINGLNAGLIWGTDHVGDLWFDTNGTRWLNYHQNDPTYNANRWGRVFPGSDVTVYTWVSSNVIPTNYAGPGVPRNLQQFSVESTLNASNVVTPVYYFWVRNTDLVMTNQGKTLSDTNLELYIRNPTSSGIAFFTPILPNAFGLYNTQPYTNSNDSVFHIGYATGNNDDPAHQEFSLIRDGVDDDFLPGLPKFGLQTEANRPDGLYDRLLDSFSGVDEVGAVVPNPYLPKAVQSGVLARPRQSFFFSRFLGLKNYLNYANTILAGFPISETRESATYLFKTGTFYDTTNYWEYVNWWLPTTNPVGQYNNNTKSIVSVPLFADLSALTVPVGSIARVETNGEGKWEMYRYDGNSVWTRVGLENGTIQFKTYLWDYATGKTGFGDNFFDTDSFDEYPSEETRWIIRALNEQIYIDELVSYRNKSLILLFEYIQSETDESQNYLPWLSKTSLVDVSHTIRELKPIQNYTSDNQVFLSSYINETKPYHVVIKDFLFRYTGLDTYDGNVTDFDLPATWDSNIQKFVSPQLVYENADNSSTFLPTNAIWQLPQYKDWFDNYGVSITGEPDHQITLLSVYLPLGSTIMFVDNASGFPINGVITIGSEQIAYSTVDRALNMLGGLQRGFDGTTPASHIPGVDIFIDLPAVVILNGGKNYIEPPQITAYIDTSIYPEPRVAAQLEAVMSVDSVISVKVINPGAGYAVLPEIRIAAAEQLFFTNTNINSTLNTISLFAPNLATGNIIQYKDDDTTSASVTGLINNQWYYINVLETNPTTVIALYTSYDKALYNFDRVVFAKGTTDGNFALNIGARASAITNAEPIRENNVAIRFDRTTYTSQILDWEADAFYGSFFAGSYFNSENVASSAISLQATQPPIGDISASAQGAVFEIVSTTNDQDILYTEFARRVTNTIATGNKIRLDPYNESNPADPLNSSGSTIGFTIGMPIKFTGAVVGNIVDGTVYYIHSIINTKDFTISATSGGGIFDVGGTNTVSSAGLSAFAGEVTNTALVTLNYPGLLTATATNGTNNTITIPQSVIGTGGTDGFYPGIPLFFTGTVFGDVVENDVYYVTTVLDDETITISDSATALNTTLVGTEVTTNYITVSSTTGFSVNDPIIFNMMSTLPSTPITDYGNIISGTIYYVREIVSATQITIATSINGSEFAVTTLGLVDAGSFNIGTTYQIVSPGTTNFVDIGAANSIIGTIFVATGAGVGTGTATTTIGVLTSQADAFDLSTATGSMTMNVSLPISPGQVNGQQFTFYDTSKYYTNIATDVDDISSNLIRSLGATVGSVDRIALKRQDAKTSNFYINMPVEFSVATGGLALATPYYVTEFSGRIVTAGSFATGQIYTITTIGTTDFTLIGAISNQVGITFTATGTGAGTGTASVNPITASCTSTSSTGNLITCGTTNSLWVGMSIIFSGAGLGNIIIGDEYFVLSIDSGTTFTIAEVAGGAAFVLSTDNGTMTGTGSEYITVSLSSGGSDVNLSDSIASFSLTQTPQAFAEFDIGFRLGGYSVVIGDGGSGYAVTNIITIPGTSIGGATPANDASLKVNSIDANGVITSLIVSGDPEDSVSQYYLKVISDSQLEVYSDARMTVPVSGIGFDFGGFTSTTVTALTATALTVTDASDFVVNDAVVFMGLSTTEAGLSGLTNSTTYYITAIATNDITVSATPGGTDIPHTLTAEVAFTIAKAGSYAFLPEPFYFDQSIVKYLNRVYRCVISNNDDEFIIGKWEELRSDNRILNALDRVEGFYQPTVNMPGLDLTQLFVGTTYPNAIYLGNAFAPEDQYALDITLKDQAFYPTDVTIPAILWNGTSYFAPANFTSYTGVIQSLTGTSWSTNKIADSVINTTDIVLGNGVYIMTSSNTATPIYKSTDGIIWTTNSSALTVPSVGLNSVAYGSDYYVAVGDGIVNSTDTTTWTKQKTYDTVFQVTLNGTDYVTTTGYTGFVAVGKGLRYDYTSGLTELVATNIIAYSSDDDGNNWSDVATLTPSGFNAVTSNGTIAIAVGENNVIYQTSNGANWTGINEVLVSGINSATDRLGVASTAGFTDADPIRFSDSFSSLTAGTTYYVKVINTTQVQIYIDAGLTTLVALTNGAIPDQCRMYYYDVTDVTLNDIIYSNSLWMTVGNTGRIQTSTDGLTWTTQTSGTTENLQGITYNSTATAFVAVGDNNTILQSLDDGVTWTSSSIFTITDPTYDVKGAEFGFGYGPEELVPGYLKDNLTMTVNTRPGTLWNATQYSHTGFNVVSRVLTPTSSSQVDYSFDAFVQYPIDLSVQIIDPTTGLGTGLATSEYTIDWPTKVITLNTPLSTGPDQTLRVDAYEVGNGNQLVKANTDTDAIREITSTGFYDIYLNCNFADTFFQGSGLIKPSSIPVEVTATETIASSDRIVCDSISKFGLNSPITFQGAVFGGIAEDTVYYVKTISTATNTITVSTSLASGIAGPTVALTDATGLMVANIQVGTGLTWTPPIVYHNGTKLIEGNNNTITRTKSSNNAITTGTTSGLSAGDRIYFAADIFGSDITPNSLYYIKTLVDGNEFTISETLNGTVVTLSNASGLSSFVTNDYAISVQPNNIQAKLVFGPPTSWANATDYVVYSLFGESPTATQYAYSMPEMQEFVADGAKVSFALTNFVGDTNPHNAIVEIDGLRRSISEYTISSSANTLVFTNGAPTNGAKIRVLTYNDTDRQYLTTQYNLSGSSSGTFGTVTVTATTHTEGTFDQDAPSAQSFDQDTPLVVTYDEDLNTLTCADTSGLIVNEPIAFSSPTLGGLVAGTTYYVLEIINSTTFTISLTIGGTPVVLTTDAGSMVGTLNAVSVNSVQNISTAIEPALATTNAIATAVTTNVITFNSTANFVVGATIYFQGTNFGELTQGLVYFVESIDVDGVSATIMDADGTQISLTTGSGAMLVTVGGLPTTRITTTLEHGFNNSIVTSGAFEVGSQYIILTLDDGVGATTDFTLIGAANNDLGTIFIATGVGAGTGTAQITDRCIIDGCVGAEQLNGNTYYVRVITPTVFDIYYQVYNPLPYVTTYPVIGVTNYISGGYVWRQGTFFLITTTATETVASTNSITSVDVSGLIPNTPVLFTLQGKQAGDALLGGIIQGTTYYVKTTDINTQTFTISTTTTNGVADAIFPLSNDTGAMNVTQWEQTFVDRLWITVNGARVPNDKLRLSTDNEVSILTAIVPGDVVIMTNMIPHSTPDEEIYKNTVDSDQNASIYRANVQSRTWLSNSLFTLSTRVAVGNIDRITDKVIQNVIAPSPVTGTYSIGLTADKDTVTGVKVLNNTTGLYISSNFVSIVVENLAPILNITDGAHITAGDSLTITSYEGNLIYVNGEQIGFSNIDFDTNSVGGLQRGMNGTAMQSSIPIYTEVVGLLANNKLSNVYYNQTWNSYTFNAVLGDPLQISTTVPAQFLHTDVT
mgnify:FL=1